MIDETLRRFCESRYRRIIVTAGTFIVGLVLVLPLVDVYCAEREEKTTLLAELATANQVAEMLGQYEARALEKSTQLEEFEARTASEETLPELRTKLVELARESGCGLRRLNVGEKSSRTWNPGDDPVTQVTPATTDPTAASSGFTLEWWPVTVLLSGSDENLRNLLDRMDAEGMLMHTKSLEMHPASAGRKTLDLDMELWFYNLARSNGG
jgi:hypothetical protein